MATPTILEMVLSEGKNREVRRMLAKLGHKVMSLTRIAVGPVTIKGLTAGSVRPLTTTEVGLLRKVAAGEYVAPFAFEKRSSRAPKRAEGMQSGPGRPTTHSNEERRPQSGNAGGRPQSGQGRPQSGDPECGADQLDGRRVVADRNLVIGRRAVVGPQPDAMIAPSTTAMIMRKIAKVLCRSLRDRSFVPASRSLGPRNCRPRSARRLVVRIVLPKQTQADRRRARVRPDPPKPPARRNDSERLIEPSGNDFSPSRGRRVIGMDGDSGAGSPPPPARAKRAPLKPKPPRKAPGPLKPRRRRPGEAN